ncbi:flagellar hook assembly protein FlgD [Biostraticola tofi]|uniref:Basal-body rod modification protein FlgD n=1 Tax=Biostraticola tofi TaxID=466109 RepID=A0A4R3YSS0_9GAMM|nr:flagellar hook capping FlgD N-terminal domain-containing protein [Biostraticola tofi]TCV95541.1 flagellar basal-body rod modification protein FlgD [Biostraticola tofi]
MSLSPLMDGAGQANGRMPANSRSAPGPQAPAAQGQPDIPANSSDAIMDNFLKMMIAQMANQDPTNPMNNNEFTSQIAQISTVGGIEKLNKTLEGVGNVAVGLHSSSLAQWVGRKVLVIGDPKVSAAGNAEFGLFLNTDADQVEVTYTGKDGSTYVKTLTNVKAGASKYHMDDVVPEPELDPDKGPFTVSFTATNEDGSTPTITALKAATVESVIFIPGSFGKLNLGLDGTVEFNEIVMME